MQIPLVDGLEIGLSVFPVTRKGHTPQLVGSSYSFFPLIMTISPLLSLKVATGLIQRVSVVVDHLIGKARMLDLLTLLKAHI